MNLLRTLILAVVALVQGQAFAQNYAIDWYTIDGGGGTSTGGVYAVSGTIGQPDAGTMSGGQYTLSGGFWSVVSAVQMPGAPFLSVFLTSTNSVVVSWPAGVSGFVLQQNPDVGTANWKNVSQVPADVGTNKVVVVKPPVGNLFFRLAK